LRFKKNLNKNIMMTKIKLTAVLFIIAAFLSIKTTNAQTIGDGKLRFGIGADALLPVGGLSNTESFALGITPRLQYRLSDKLALTFTSGFYHFFPKNYHYTGGPDAGYYAKYHLDIVPVKVGLKAFVSKNIYLAGEVGAGFEVEDGGGPVKLILSPSVGYANKHWDLGVRYENFSGDNNAYGVVGVRVAYGLGL
jgi:hypothetical protein